MEAHSVLSYVAVVVVVVVVHRDENDDDSTFDDPPPSLWLDDVDAVTSKYARTVPAPKSVFLGRGNYSSGDRGGSDRRRRTMTP